jgi:hypothetical protein
MYVRLKRCNSGVQDLRKSISTDVVLQTYTQGKMSTGGIKNVFKGSRKASPFQEWSNEDAKTVIERVNFMTSR